MAALQVPPAAAEFPMAFGQWNVRGDSLVCQLPRSTVRVTAPGELLQKVQQLCDGRLRWKEVAEKLGRRWEPAAVQGFLSDLCAEGALVEAGESLANWAELGQVPGLHVPVASLQELPRLPALARARLLPGRGHCASFAASEGLQQLLSLRESVRTFADAPLTADALAAIAWAAHGVTRAATGSVGWHRTIASGGNMHSTRWFVFVLRELRAGETAAALPAGLYEARFHLQGGASFEAHPGAWEDAWRLLGDPRLLQFASAMLVPVCDVAVPARKYGNRATLFAHVEAGAALQNAQLMSAALGAATVVRGDIAAATALSALSAALRGAGEAVRPHWLVMPSLVVGAMPSPGEVQASEGGKRFHMGWGPLAGDDEAAPCFAFTASSMEQPGIGGLGRSTDPLLAMRKAEAEAWERLGWRWLGPHVRGKAAAMPGALDPQQFCAYADRQYASAGFGLQRFSPERDYVWRAGVEVGSGRTVHVPAECLHPAAALPLWARRQPCANASTSGMAAWPDAEGALCRATLELVERDAFLRRWLSGVPGPLVAIPSLPEAARRRVTALQARGFRVGVASIGQGWVPVVSVFLQCLSRPLTAITAAADFDAEAALHKALDEAEGRAAFGEVLARRQLARASQVRTSVDVQCYYQTPRFHRRSDFYADGDASLDFASAQQAACKDWPALEAQLAAAGHTLFAFDLTPAGAAVDQGRTRLHVARALVTGLVPIWFQYGMAPAGLPALRAALAGSTRDDPEDFMHPFT